MAPGFCRWGSVSFSPLQRTDKTGNEDIIEGKELLIILLIILEFLCISSSRKWSRLTVLPINRGWIDETECIFSFTALEKIRMEMYCYSELQTRTGIG